MLNLNQAETFNCLAWVLKNHIKNENGSPIEFADHQFLIDPYMDCTPKQAIIKCSQIGWSVLAIIRSFHLAYFAKANIIHTFPSRNMSKDFVVPKVNPIIEKNPVIQKMIGKDSVFLKQIGDRYIYYRGTYEETEAISISANILINDEYDRSNPKVLRTYRSRLDDSARERPELGWEWKFSNPSIPGYGVDQDWQKSDMKHWFVKCRYCGHEGYMRWPDSIDFKRKTKICYKCQTDLSRDDLRNGRWVKKYLNKEISGYWLSQLFVPWIPASKIIDDAKGDQGVFHNFTLGLPYVSKDTTISRQSIMDCISPGYNSKTDVAIGVDNGVIKHYVIGNRQGIFDYGKTDNWQDIEDLRNRYNAVMVIDAMPYPNTPNKLAEKYPGKVFVHFYQRDASSGDLVRWSHESRTVKSDRTKIIDFVVGEINSKDVTFNLTITELEEYFTHWKSMYRIIQDTPLGVKRPVWQSIDGRPDHYAHCLSGDTLITTIKGNIQIKNIKVGDLVLTRKGFRRVYKSWLVENNAIVLRSVFSSGSVLVGTKEHKVFTSNRKFVELQKLAKYDKMVVCHNAKSLYFKVLHIVGILTQKIDLIGFISLVMGQKGKKEEKGITKNFGSRLMVPFRQGWQFTTKMVIHLIMLLKTFVLWLEGNISRIMLRKDSRIRNTGKETRNFLVKFNLSLTLGEKQKKVGNGTRNMLLKLLSWRFLKNLNVLNVVPLAKQLAGRVVSFVARDVTIVGTPVSGGRSDVYDLSVEGEHEYFANGILVSNSTVYWRIALEQTLSMGGISKSSPVSARLIEKNPVISEDQTMRALDLDAVAERAGRRKRR